MNDDQPFYAPDRKPLAPRQPKPGEHLWSIRKDGQRLDCELRDHGAWELRCKCIGGDQFLYGRRWPTRALTLEEADVQNSAYLSKGGVVIT
jgi:hypothetical protein